MRRLLLLVPVLAACETEKIELGQGGDDDARLFADAYTWACEDRTDPDNPYIYEGVYSYEVSLEYAPDSLVSRALPSSGCTKGLDLFPASAGAGGQNIPETGDPTWSNLNSSGDYGFGELENQSPGFYFDDAFGNVDNCLFADEYIGEGTSITGAGVFSGARSPEAGQLADVEIGGYDEAVGIVFGDTLEASWTPVGWDTGWVQIRREYSGELVESVTCAAPGNGYTVDDDVWSLMNEYIEADVTDLYIVVQNEKTVETEDGQKLHAYTRVVTAASVH